MVCSDLRHISAPEKEHKKTQNEAENGEKMMKKWIRVSLVLVLIAGLGLLLYPDVQRCLLQRQAREKIERFREQYKITQDDSKKGYEPDSELWERMAEYNKRIFEEKQQGLKDAWSYRQNEFDFSEIGLDEDMVGYLTIEALDYETPLYVGATAENMYDAAAVLFETSMPIGGENTNCVIASHRGARKLPLFRDIEDLKKGDRVQIRNPWEMLEYQVEKAIVIYPDENDKVKIQEGKDMVTLVTCHPYGDNYQRYVVYCSRVSEEREVQETEITVEGVKYESSAPVSYTHLTLPTT